MDDVYALIAAQRREVADVLDGLSAEQWNTPSLCAGWTMKDVAAHLAMPFSISVPKLLVKLAMKGFNFDKVADEWAKSEQRPPTQLAKLLRQNADNRFKPPGLGPEAPLTDIVVHGQDIRRPLGIAHRVPADTARVVLDFLVSKKASKGFTKKGVADGLRFEATDTGWTHGAGAAVSGTAEALILSLSGRKAALADLTGAGADQLRARLSA